MSGGPEAPVEQPIAALAQPEANQTTAPTGEERALRKEWQKVKAEHEQEIKANKSQPTTEAKERESQQNPARSIGEAVALEFQLDITESNETNLANLTVVVDTTGTVHTITVSQAEAKMILPGTGEAPTLEEFVKKFQKALPLMDGVQLVRSLRFAEKLKRSARELNAAGFDESTIAELYAVAQAIDSSTRIEVKLRIPSIAHMSFEDRDIPDTANLTQRVTNVASDTEEQSSQPEAEPAATSLNLTRQLLEIEAKFFFGDQVRFRTSEANAVAVVDMGNGNVLIVMPDNSTAQDLARLAAEYSRLSPGRENQTTRIEQFAQQLEETSLLMAQQGFTETSFMAVNEMARQLQLTVHSENASLTQPRTAEEIRNQADNTTFTREQQRDLYMTMLYGEGVQSSYFERHVAIAQKKNPDRSIDQIRQEERARLMRLIEANGGNNRYMRGIMHAVDSSIRAGEAGRAAQSYEQAVQQRAHETITQEHVDRWVNAINAQDVRTKEYMETVHEALAQEGINVQRNLRAEERITVLTDFLRSKDGTAALSYLPADILKVLQESQTNPELQEKQLVEMACIYKVAKLLETLSQFDDLKDNIGVVRNGVHIWLVARVGDKYICIDPSTPEQLLIKGVATELSGVTDITGDKERKEAEAAIANQQNGKQVILSCFYTNAAMLCKDPDVRRALLQQAVMADPNNLIALYALDPEKALSRDPKIAEEWERTKGKIGAFPTSPFPANNAAQGVLRRLEARFNALRKPAFNINRLPVSQLEGAMQQLLMIQSNLRPGSPAVNEINTWLDHIDEALNNPTINPATGLPDPDYEGAREREASQKNKDYEFQGIDSIDRSGAYGAEAIDNYIRGIILVGGTRDQVFEQEAVKTLNRMIDKNSLDGDHYPRKILELAMYFDEARDKIMNQIVWKSYEDPSELNDYEISFYADPRFRQMHNSLKVAARLARAAGDSAKADAYMKRYEYYVGLKTAAKVSHGMNKLVNVGEITSLAKVAQEMNKEHFYLMSQVPGSGEIMTIYEVEYTRVLARDKEITPQGYDEIKTNVVIGIRKLNDSGVIKSEFTDQRSGPDAQKMEDWEVHRAFSAGRALYNMFLRSSMHIAFSQIPENVRTSLSFPQGRIVETLNPWDTIFERWKMGSEWGGPAFVALDTAEWFHDMTEYGYIQGINKIYMVGNKNMESVQKAAQLKFVDFLSGFRLFNIGFPVVYRNDGISLAEYFNRNGSRISQLQEQHDRVRLNAELRQLIDSTDLGLGPLLMHSAFFNESEDPRDTYEARVYLWQKALRTNPLMAADYLTGLQFAQKDANGVMLRHKEDDPAGRYKKGDVIVDTTIGIQSLEQIISAQWGYDWAELNNPRFLAAITGPTDPLLAQKTRAQEWKTLHEKMQHNRMVFEQNAMLRNPNSKASQARNKGQTIPAALPYTAQEQLIINQIEANGQLLATHLADVYWNNCPFIDIPYGDLDYKQLGSDEYRRKVAGDTSQLYQAFSALLNIGKRPGGQNAKAMVENLKAIIDNYEDVEGGVVAQRHTKPIGKILLAWKATDKGRRFGPRHAVESGLGIATSEAQRLQGIQAESLDEWGLHDAVGELVAAGIFTPAFGKKIEDEIDADLISRLLAILRDLGYLAPVIVVAPFVEEAVGLKAA